VIRQKKHERDREIHHINKTMCFYLCKQRQLANQERVFESRDHHNAKWTFTSQDHQLSKISPILRVWFLDDKYLSFIMTHFLLKIGPKSSLQSRTVLFSDRWWGISTGVLNYDTFFHCEELQNSGKSFYDKRTRDYSISCLKMAIARSY